MTTLSPSAILPTAAPHPTPETAVSLPIVAAALAEMLANLPPQSRGRNVVSGIVRSYRHQELDAAYGEEIRVGKAMKEWARDFPPMVWASERDRAAFVAEGV